MRQEDLQRRIVALVRAHGRISAESLAAQLAASRETIRRDLGDLARRGELLKFHGGAAVLESAGESAFHARLHENEPQKRAVARRAAALFAPGDSLFIDTGTTTLFLAEELAKQSGLTVITNASAIAQMVSRGEDNEVFLIGGRFSPDASESLGALALEQIDRFRPMHAVITVGAVDGEGARDFSLEEAEVARAMIARARKTTIIADTSKIDRPALYPVCPLAAVHRLVMNRLPQGDLAQAVRAAGVELIEAGEEGGA